MKPFILNDETKTNSYDFRVKNSALNLDRFMSNPILLEMHNRGHVHGYWKDIRIEGNYLLGIPEFDLHDPKSLILAGKVERGFLKGASLGLDTSKANYVTGNDLIPELCNAEVMEASIVDMPSNANSLRLYAGSVPLQKNEITSLFLSSGIILNDKIITLDDFEKMGLSEQLKFKRNNLSQYENLFSKKPNLNGNIKLTILEAIKIQTINDFMELTHAQQMAFRENFKNQYQHLFNAK